MKTLGFVLLFLGAVGLALGADLSGKWSGTFTSDEGNSSGALLILKQSGTSITGTAGPDDTQQWDIQSGKIEENKVVLDVGSPHGKFKFDLVLSGDTLKGDVSGSREGAPPVKGKVELSRVK